MTASGHRSILMTPLGAGAIAVIRIVGPDPVTLVNHMFRPKTGTPLSLQNTDRLRYGFFVDGDEVIDDVIVCVSHVEPRSLEGNMRQAVDISAHGGVRVVARILQTLDRLGAPASDPFGALQDVWPARNIIEGEAIHVMCLAKTQRTLRFLSWQRMHLGEALEALTAMIPTDAGLARLELEAMIAKYPKAHTLLHGAVVALVGPPNSGKSTLFNRLLGRPAAIVSPVAGTTRDWIAEAIEVDGVPITLVDTAGLHESRDPLERLAVEAGQKMAQRADVHVLVLDGTEHREGDHAVPVNFCANPTRMVSVLNKCDLEIAGKGCPSAEFLSISGKMGAGIDDLLSRIKDVLGLSGWREKEPCFFTDRQIQVARAAAAALPDNPASATHQVLDKLIGPKFPDESDERAIMS